MYKAGEVVKIKKELFIVKEFIGDVFSCARCEFGKPVTSFGEPVTLSTCYRCILPKFYHRKDGNGRCPLYAHCSFIKIGKGGV